jgi:hypothetical protein
MQPGQHQIVVPAWYKRYCPVGARKLPYNAVCTHIRYGDDAPTVSMERTVRKLPYHAARTVRAYDTVVTHRQ